MSAESEHICDPDVGGCGQPMTPAEWNHRHYYGQPGWGGLSPLHEDCCPCNIDRLRVTCPSCEVDMSAPHGDHDCPHCGTVLEPAAPMVGPAQGQLL